MNKKILIYCIGALGDTIIALPALKAIRRHYGASAHISLMHEFRPLNSASPSTILAGMNIVNEFIVYKKHNNHFREWIYLIALVFKLRAKRFEDVVYLAPSERLSSSVKRDALFFRLCGINNEIGFISFPSHVLYPVYPGGLPAPVQHEAMFLLERLKCDGIDVAEESDLEKPFFYIPELHVNEARQWLSKNRRKPSLPLVAICPGCKEPSNVWPVPRFVEIGHRLVQQGLTEIVVVGGPDEREIGRQMVETWGSGLNAAGTFAPLGSAALLGECSFMIGLDTGTTHLASAQGVPCISMYGCQKEPGRFYPLGKDHVVLRNPVSCAGCRLINEPCPVAGHPCMMGITVESVWAAIKSMQTSLFGYQNAG